MWVLVPLLVVILLLAPALGAFAATDQLVDPSAIAWAKTLSWPGACALVAFSPLGKGLGLWLQSLGGNRPSAAATPSQQAAIDRLAAAMERQAECLERQAGVLQQVQLALGVLLDRGNRAA